MISKYFDSRNATHEYLVVSGWSVPCTSSERYLWRGWFRCCWCVGALFMHRYLRLWVGWQDSYFSWDKVHLQVGCCMCAPLPPSLSQLVQHGLSVVEDTRGAIKVKRTMKINFLLDRDPWRLEKCPKQQRAVNGVSCEALVVSTEKK